MSLLARKAVVLAKVETTAGTDSVPTGAANAIQVGNIRWTPMEVSEAQRNNLQAHLGHRGSVVSWAYGKLGFDVELAGSGAAGTAPGWGVLMLGCAMAETVTTATKVEYLPVSASQQTLSIYFNNDGIQQKLLYSRGTFSVKMSRGQIPTLSFEFTGLYSAVTDTALPSATLTAFQAPLPVNKANTTPFTLHGYAAAMDSLSIDMANSNVYRNLVGQEVVMHVDRAPTGQISIEHPTVAQKDFYTIVRNATTGALALTHGTVAGNIVKLDAPAVQLTKPATSDSDGILMLGMGMNFRASSGNDELKITVQ